MDAIRSFFIICDCFFIILFVFFSSEKNSVDLFSEQYGNAHTTKSEIFFHALMFLFVSIILGISVYNLYSQFPN